MLSALFRFHTLVSINFQDAGCFECFRQACEDSKSESRTGSNMGEPVGRDQQTLIGARCDLEMQSWSRQ